MTRTSALPVSWRSTAALSIQTSARTPYDDAATDDGFLYAYRDGSVDQADNRALRAANLLAVPIVYCVATRQGWYEPLYPYYVLEDRPAERRVLVSVGPRVGPIDELEPTPILDPIERRYAARQVKVRLHQRRFRGWSSRLSPDFVVHVAGRLLDDEDGPMLELLKGFEGSRIDLPRRSAHHPDPERLALRFEEFESAN